MGKIIHTNKVALMSATVYGFRRDGNGGYATTANAFNSLEGNCVTFI